MAGARILPGAWVAMLEGDTDGVLHTLAPESECPATCRTQGERLARRASCTRVVFVTPVVITSPSARTCSRAVRQGNGYSTPCAVCRVCHVGTVREVPRRPLTILPLLLLPPARGYPPPTHPLSSRCTRPTTGPAAARPLPNHQGLVHQALPINPCAWGAGVLSFVDWRFVHPCRARAVFRSCRCARRALRGYGVAWMDSMIRQAPRRRILLTPFFLWHDVYSLGNLSCQPPAGVAGKCYCSNVTSAGTRTPPPPPPHPCAAGTSFGCGSSTFAGQSDGATLRITGALTPALLREKDPKTVADVLQSATTVKGGLLVVGVDAEFPVLLNLRAIEGKHGHSSPTAWVQNECGKGEGGGGSSRRARRLFPFCDPCVVCHLAMCLPASSGATGPLLAR